MHYYAFMSIKPNSQTTILLENLYNIFDRQYVCSEFLKWMVSVKKNLNDEFSMESKAFLAETVIFPTLSKRIKIKKRGSASFYLHTSKVHLGIFS